MPGYSENELSRETVATVRGSGHVREGARDDSDEMPVVWDREQLMTLSEHRVLREDQRFRNKGPAPGAADSPKQKEPEVCVGALSGEENTAKIPVETEIEATAQLPQAPVRDQGSTGHDRDPPTIAGSKQPQREGCEQHQQSPDMRRYLKKRMILAQRAAAERERLLELRKSRRSSPSPLHLQPQTAHGTTSTGPGAAAPSPATPNLPLLGGAKMSWAMLCSLSESVEEAEAGLRPTCDPMLAEAREMALNATGPARFYSSGHGDKSDRFEAKAIAEAEKATRPAAEVEDEVVRIIREMEEEDAHYEKAAAECNAKKADEANMENTIKRYAQRGARTDSAAQSTQQPQQPQQQAESSSSSGTFNLDSAYHDLSVRLRNWQVSTTQGVQFIKDGLNKIATSAPKADEGPFELDAVHTEIRPQAVETKTEENTALAHVVDIAVSGNEQHEPRLDGAKKDNARGRPRRRHQATQVRMKSVCSYKDAETMAFDVVDSADGEEPGEWYDMDEVENCGGECEDDAECAEMAICKVSRREGPLPLGVTAPPLEDLDEEYVVV
ncbi:hypothetical protein EsH8_X_000613 [Colletotrichum jinshuiense]